MRHFTGGHKTKPRWPMMKFWSAIGVMIGLPMAIADPVPQTLSECRSIASDADRLECYDQAIALSLPQRDGERDESARENKETTTRASDPAIDHEELFGKSEVRVVEELRERSGREQTKEIRAVVVRVDRTPRRKLVITLENGHIWRQIDAARLKIKAGQAVVIRRASLGSFLLSAEDGNRSIRVERAD